MRDFARLQTDLVTDDSEVMWRVLANAVAAGRLPAAALTDVEIQVSPPSLAVRDQKQEVEMYQIEYQNGILSPQTWSQRRGLDYGQEQTNFRSTPSGPKKHQAASYSTRQRDGRTDHGRQCHCRIETEMRVRTSLTWHCSKMLSNEHLNVTTNCGSQ